MLKGLRGKVAAVFSMHRKNAVMILLSLCIAAVCSGFTFAAQNVVTIEESGRIPVQITTSDTNVGRILSKQGIVVSQGDKVNYALSDEIGNDAVIRIDRAVSVKVSYMGETKEYRTTSTKVADILRELDIPADAGDQVSPGLDSTVESGAEISVVLHDVHTVTVQEEIAYPVEERENPNLSAGERRVVQAGQNGVVEYEYNIRYENGKEVSRQLVRETRLSEPVEEIVECGAEDVWQLGVVPASRPVSYKRVARFQATAYDASPSDNGIWAGQTSTGMPLVYGVVAVDPRVIPYGTKMYIESVDGQYRYGYAIAGDCGGAIKGNRVDLFFPSRSTCYQFGRRDVNIYFLD